VLFILILFLKVLLFLFLFLILLLLLLNPFLLGYCGGGALIKGKKVLHTNRQTYKANTELLYQGSDVILGGSLAIYILCGCRSDKFYYNNLLFFTTDFL